MGSGKTSWIIERMKSNQNENILYITPFLPEDERIVQALHGFRDIKQPQHKGSGKLGNIAKLLESQMDIASTHELFRRFDERCKKALKENEYTLIVDEALTAVEQYRWDKKEDFKYLLEKNDINITPNGLIEWTGKNLDTRFNDVRILSQNHCLYKIDDKFFLWHFPHEIFALFKQVYVLTYLFDGSLMKYYFDLCGLTYDVKSIQSANGDYKLVEYYEPDKTAYRKRLNIYSGQLNDNISKKDKILSATWCGSPYYKPNREVLKKNLYNYSRNIINAKSNEIMWTAFKSCRKEFVQKGYARGFIPCNCRATNDYSDRTCLMYCVNWYVNPEIKKFFQIRNITIDEDAVALSNLLQWIWRSNIRVADSNKEISIYIPSGRMRKLLLNWLNC